MDRLKYDIYFLFFITIKFYSTTKLNSCNFILSYIRMRAHTSPNPYFSLSILIYRATPSPPRRRSLTHNNLAAAESHMHPPSLAGIALLPSVAALCLAQRSFRFASRELLCTLFFKEYSRPQIFSFIL